MPTQRGTARPAADAIEVTADYRLRVVIPRGRRSRSLGTTVRGAAHLEQPDCAHSQSRIIREETTGICRRRKSFHPSGFAAAPEMEKAGDWALRRVLIFAGRWLISPDRSELALFEGPDPLYPRTNGATSIGISRGSDAGASGRLISPRERPVRSSKSDEPGFFAAASVSLFKDGCPPPSS